MKKLIIFLFAIFFISMVSAVPPVRVATGDVGIDIQFSNYETSRVNTSFTLNVHAFNKSDGLILTGTTTDCDLHLYGGSGAELYHEMFNESGNTFSALILNDVFLQLGLHSYTIHCNSSVVGGFASGIYSVTNSGIEWRDEMVSFINIFIILLIIVGGLFMVGFVKEDKIQIKWSMFIIGFMFFLAALNTAGVAIYDSLVTSALISFVDSFTGIMFIVFWICAGLLAVIWLLTMLRALLFNKSMKQAAKFGGMMQ